MNVSAFRAIRAYNIPDALIQSVEEILTNFGVDISFITIQSAERINGSKGRGRSWQIFSQDPFRIVFTIQLATGSGNAWKVFLNDSSESDQFLTAFQHIPAKAWQTSFKDERKTSVEASLQEGPVSSVELQVKPFRPEDFWNPAKRSELKALLGTHWSQNDLRAGVETMLEESDWANCGPTALDQTLTYFAKHQILVPPQVNPHQPMPPANNAGPDLQLLDLAEELVGLQASHEDVQSEIARIRESITRKKAELDRVKQSRQTPVLQEDAAENRALQERDAADREVERLEESLAKAKQRAAEARAAHQHAMELRQQKVQQFHANQIQPIEDALKELSNSLEEAQRSEAEIKAKLNAPTMQKVLSLVTLLRGANKPRTVRG